MVLPEHIISHTNAAVFLHVTEDEKILPPLKGLSFLDRFLVIWIILAMAIGIVLGNTVDSVGPALQKGEFVGVSIPIGTCLDVLIPYPGRCYFGCTAIKCFP
jgi:ACR3 family arsenite transporter